MGTAHVDHQKDVIGLVFSQRLGRQAREKQIDPAQTREGQVRTGTFAAMSCRADSAATMNRYD
jgi:hypothetical protein